jgi:LysM repeat protein
MAASRSEPIIYDYPGATRNLNAPTPAPAATVTTTTPKPADTSTAGGLRYHTVLSGDTLWGLSKKYNVTVDALRAANGLTTDTIKPGQNLKMP